MALNCFDDPAYAPPADLSPEDARAYEEAVLLGVLEGIRVGRYDPWIIESIELEGVRPDTVVVFSYYPQSNPQGRLVARASIWDDLAEEVGGRLLLDSARSHGNHIGSAFEVDRLRQVGR